MKTTDSIGNIKMIKTDIKCPKCNSNLILKRDENESPCFVIACNGKGVIWG